MQLAVAGKPAYQRVGRREFSVAAHRPSLPTPRRRFGAQSAPRIPVTERFFSPTLAAASQTEAVQAEVPAVLTPFQELSSAKERMALLLQIGREFASLPSDQMTIANRVMGCTTKTYLVVDQASNGTINFCGTSDSELTKGLISLLTQHLSGSSAEKILKFDPQSFLPVLSAPGVMTASRTNGFLNLVETLKRKTRVLLKDFAKFPSLLITSSGLAPQGTFAESQAQFMEPDPKAVAELAAALREKKVGVVAHFYMDPEVQGVLTAAMDLWPHIRICDSLAMADGAQAMVEAGCKHIAVLGVDFMSENVQAILDKAGITGVNVFRMSSDAIGCSLAEAAESVAYMKYLSDAAELKESSLHVVYINTSLATKAQSHNIIPTISCTSSNVVQTILQAFAQVQDLRIFYGPDTYMGQNIKDMFTAMSKMSDEEIKAIHPQHNRQTLQTVLKRFDFFQEGSCVVHQLFGGDVCQTVREAYGDAYIAAHFEVPGEMFALAMEAKQRGMGVIGSTKNILDYIVDTVKEQGSNRTTDQLQFILGTESGVVTSIVNRVKTVLNENPSLRDLEVEIVFPVATGAITTTSQTVEKPISLPDALDVVPGVAVGEGCSSEGGCANCPYMKMNTLDALKYVLSGIGPDAAIDDGLSDYGPPAYTETIKGAGGALLSMQDLGTETILNMRYFQKNGKLSPEFVDSIVR